MRYLFRFTTALVIAGVSLSAVRPASAAVAAPSGAYAELAGHWSIDIVLGCNSAVKGKNACHLPFIQVSLISVDAKSNGTYTLTGTFFDQTDDPTAPMACGTGQIGHNGDLNGQCVYTRVGTGFFAPGKKNGGVDFWQKNTTFHFPNGRSVHNPSQTGPYPKDTGVPARPMTLDTAATLKLLRGISGNPAGFVAHLTVTHAP